MKKGFTLIELLAVIVVLAVIAIIAIPIIINIIEKSEKGAFQDSGYGLVESANTYFAQNMKEIEGYVLFEFENGVQKGEKKLSYKGNIKGSGQLVLTNKGEVALCIAKDNMYLKKTLKNSKVTLTEANGAIQCEMPNVTDNDFTMTIVGGNSSYYTKDEINDKLDGFYTKDEVDTKIEEVKTTLSGVNFIPVKSSIIQLYPATTDGNQIIGGWYGSTSACNSGNEVYYYTTNKIDVTNIDTLTITFTASTNNTGDGLWASATATIGIGNGIEYAKKATFNYYAVAVGSRSISVNVSEDTGYYNIIVKLAGANYTESGKYYARCISLNKVTLTLKAN